MYNYGLIGDMSSAALVGSDGSVDWCCLPRFDSPSVFASILDEDIGGRFRIQPSGAHTDAPGLLAGHQHPGDHLHYEQGWREGG